MNVPIRQKVERTIVGQVVDDLLKQGPLSVNIGDEADEYTGFDKERIMDHLLAGDDATIFLADGRFVMFVYGNNGFDVIHDYSTSLEPFLAQAKTIARKIENGDFEFAFSEIAERICKS